MDTIGTPNVYTPQEPTADGQGSPFEPLQTSSAPKPPPGRNRQPAASSSRWWVSRGERRDMRESNSGLKLEDDVESA